MACPSDIAIAITHKDSAKTVTVNLVDILTRVAREYEIKPAGYDIEDVVNDVIQSMGKLE